MIRKIQTTFQKQSQLGMSPRAAPRESDEWQQRATACLLLPEAWVLDIRERPPRFNIQSPSLEILITQLGTDSPGNIRMRYMIPRSAFQPQPSCDFTTSEVSDMSDCKKHKKELSPCSQEWRIPSPW